MAMFLNCLMVGAGGFVGSVLRYLFGLIPFDMADGFPYKTLIINVVGAFAIGLICAFVAKGAHLDEKVVLLLKVGVCGGFTTFSTFAYETTELLKNGNWKVALLYIVLSVILSVLAVLGADACVNGVQKQN